MARFLALLGVVAVVVVVVGGPAAYLVRRNTHQRNFRVVEDGKLYRSGQLPADVLGRVIDEYGIRTVVSLRFSDRDEGVPPDADEERSCRQRGLNYVRIRPKVWRGTPSPAEESVGQFLDVVSKPENRPILVHCFAGVHRTGAYCAVYRMEFQGWTNADALRELKSWGYVNLDAEEDVSGFLESYSPRSKRDKPR